ncbi:MAG: tetratricopeptide (TPR) repeat protein [Saprospiraceae bacterium]|jgi:tetratricopeptide (TPR) repeat protein
MIRIILFFSMIMVVACGEPSEQAASMANEKVDKEVLKSELDQLEEVLKSNTSTTINNAKANLLIEKSIQYINAFPKDELSGGYLFRAGEVSVGIKEYKKAIDYWERMKKEYSTHKRASIALFLQGFTCDNQMRDIEGAKKYYNEFLIKYPDHEYADQVKELLKNIDISPEELVKSFQKKREAESR